MLQQHFPLTDRNTLRLVSEASAYAGFRSLAELIQLQGYATRAQLPLRVLGGGSNVLLSEKVNALVVQSESCRIQLVMQNDEVSLVDVDAGMNWHQWVEQSIAFGHGIENLALIPGTVGAAPVQNIGAYGVEVGEFIDSVTGYQLSTRQLRTFSAAECRFGYRDSVFKRELRNDFVILRVRFRLPRRFSPVVSYAPLNSLNAAEITPASLIQAVTDIRMSKLPDPANVPNAGSFFQNPVVSDECARQLAARYPDLPVYAQPHGAKLAAGWLIDQCGFRGKPFGPVAMYEKQALVLTTSSGATLADVRALQKRVQDSVYEKFGVWLEPEPQLFA